MDGSFNLYVIRHLETMANRERRYVGWTDVPVCAEAEPADFTPGMLTGSDLLRCRQTAELLFPKTSYEARREFREADFGKWEMKTYDDLKGHPRYRRWIDDPATEYPPGGERLADMEARVLRGIRRLREESGHSAAIVTHGGPARVLLTHLAPEHRPFFSWSVPAGGGFKLTWPERRSWEEGDRCTYLSEVRITGSASM